MDLSLDLCAYFLYFPPSLVYGRLSKSVHISNSELCFLHSASLSQVVFHFLMLFLPPFSICLVSGKYNNLSLSFQNTLRTALWSSSCTHPSSQRVFPVGVALVVFWGTGLPFSVDPGCSEVCCWNVSITIYMTESYVLAHKPWGTCSGLAVHTVG